MHGGNGYSETNVDIAKMKEDVKKEEELKKKEMEEEARADIGINKQSKLKIDPNKFLDPSPLMQK